MSEQKERKTINRINTRTLPETRKIIEHRGDSDTDHSFLSFFIYLFIYLFISSIDLIFFSVIPIDFNFFHSVNRIHFLILSIEFNFFLLIHWIVHIKRNICDGFCSVDGGKVHSLIHHNPFPANGVASGSFALDSKYVCFPWRVKLISLYFFIL